MQGSGVKHMLFALRNTKNGSPGQLSAVRLCAEAGLHDATEVSMLFHACVVTACASHLLASPRLQDLFFQNGAVETAMQITKSVRLIR